MTLQALADEPDQSSLVALIRRCQESHAQWGREIDEQRRAAAKAEHSACLELLYYDLAPDLRKAAVGWMRSDPGNEIEGLAMNMFVAVMVELPRLTIDPRLNVRNLLLTIARRGMIDEYRRTNPASARRRPGAATRDATPGPGDAQMWYPHECPPEHLALGGLPDDSPDPRSIDADTALIEQLDRQQLLTIIYAYWRAHLSEDDLQIMTSRMAEPPPGFREIAQKLGPGWEEDNVRQHYKRVMDRTRKYLRDQGLI